jgi:hypothetical protein
MARVEEDQTMREEEKKKKGGKEKRIEIFSGLVFLY